MNPPKKPSSLKCLPPSPSARQGQQKQANTGIVQPQRLLPQTQAKQPVAPAVYRPQPTPKVLQTKMNVAKQPGNQPFARSNTTPAAPPVYRPQPVPKVLQTKAAATPPSRAGQTSRPPPIAPPASRQGQARNMPPLKGSAIQPKQQNLPHRPMPEHRQAVIQRMILGDSNQNIWSTEIAGKVINEKESYISAAVHRSHSVETVVRVSSYEDLVSRIRQKEFDYLLIASHLESPADAKYQNSKIGEAISHNSSSQWKTDKINNQFYYARQKLGEIYNTGHHKLPKSTLEWVFDHMTDDQWTRAKEALDLSINASLNSLKSLPSNLTLGPSSGARIEDPKQGLDLNHIKDVKLGRRMSLRSAIYSQLAAYLASIGGPPLKQQRDKFTKQEFNTVLDLLTKAEKTHALLTGGGLDTEISMWKKAQQQDIEAEQKDKWQRQVFEKDQIIDASKFSSTVRDLKLPEHQSKFENPPQVHWPLYVNIGLSEKAYLALMSDEDSSQRRATIEGEEMLHNLHRAQCNKSTTYRKPNWHHGFQFLGGDTWRYKNVQGEEFHYPK
jgi:hypothetical protein